MALPININDLLNGKPVEWERLEFKAGWNPEAVLHTLCAFANDIHNLGGGYILIGIAEENGRPVLPAVGLDPAQIDSIQKELLNLGFSAIAPYYHPIAVPVEIDGRHVLVLWALGGPTRPYKAKISLGKDGKEFAYYIRKGSSTVRARGVDETELMSLASTVPHDDRINQQAKVESLSRDLMHEYLQQVGSDLVKQAPSLSLVELGRQMGVIGGPDEASFPLNVGLMMFNPEPWHFFPAMQIDVVWFPKEGPGGNKFSEKIFKGPIPRMTRDALDYIKRNLITETVIKHHGRPRRPGSRTSRMTRSRKPSSMRFITGATTLASLSRCVSNRTRYLLSAIPDQTVRCDWSNCAPAMLGQGAIATGVSVSSSRSWNLPKAERPASPRSSKPWRRMARHRPSSSSTRTTAISWCGCRSTRRRRR
jgi:hypothetical protein